MTAELPTHASALLSYLRMSGSVLLDTKGLFECWKATWLTDLEMIAGLDYLATRGLIVRSNDTSLRCRVEVKK